MFSAREAQILLDAMRSKYSFCQTTSDPELNDIVRKLTGLSDPYVCPHYQHKATKPEGQRDSHED